MTNNKYMKKFVLLFLSAVALVSCEDEIKTSDPSIQTYIGYTLWKTDYQTAQIVNNDLLIMGVRQMDTLVLMVPRYSYGKTFSVESGEARATLSVTDEAGTTTKYQATKGSITLDGAESQTSGTVTGSFKMTLGTTVGTTSYEFNAHQGTIYRVAIQ